MNKLLLLLFALSFTKHCFSQDRNRAYYLREYNTITSAGKLNYYELMYIEGENIAITSIRVFGHIGNPITTTFFIDTCFQQIGKIDSMRSGYILGDNVKRTYKIKKMGHRKLKVDLNGFNITYKQIPENVYLITKLKNLCSCCNIEKW